MKIIVTILFFFSYLNSCFGQDSLLIPPKLPPKIVRESYKEYYFRDVNFVEENKELVIIVKEPKSQFAKDFGHRIYSDTAFLRRIQEELYRVVDPNHYRKEVIDMCGYDFYFYVKSGPNLSLIKTENSGCRSYDCHYKFLDIFAESGERLQVDTLTRFKTKHNGKLEFLNSDFIYASLIETDKHGEIWQEESYGNIHFYDQNFTSNFPPEFLYDGQFDIELNVDISLSVLDNLKNYFKTFGIDSLEFRKMSFKLKNESDIEKKMGPLNTSMLHPKKPVLPMTIYISKEYFHLFKEYKIKKFARGKKHKYKLEDIERKMIVIHK